MSAYPALAHMVLIATAGVLFYAAWTDLRIFKIRDELILALVVLFALHALLSGRWITVHWNVLIAVLVFLVSVTLYVRKGLGGGDIKLLTVSFLWVGYGCALPFSVLLLAFAGIHAIIAKSVWFGVLSARYGWINLVAVDHKRVPFAPTIAASLIGTFMLGCFDTPY